MSSQSILNSCTALQIRAARTSDFPALLEIEQLCFSSPTWGIEQFTGYDCLIAELDDQVVGFLVSRLLVAAEGEQPAERELLNLGVHPSARKRGVGAALIAEELRRGAVEYLEARESNAVALHLYRKVGFREIGRRDGYYSNPAEAAIVMKRD